MKRIHLEPRKDWQQKVEELGMGYHSVGGTYWDESACYEFSPSEIDMIEDVTDELHQMCLESVDKIIQNDWFDRLAINPKTAMSIVKSWENKEEGIYGRFDLSYDGIHPPKMLEYNADTPTSLFESSVVQWMWLEEVFPQYDQYNFIHEQLIKQWDMLAKQLKQPVYFGCVDDSMEDLITTEYLRDTAIQAKLATKHIFVRDIGKTDRDIFVDLQEKEIGALFKLYPWEWIISEDFGDAIQQQSHMRVIEPIWKLLLSNKAILAILWELFPKHPNLLPSFFEKSLLGQEYVKKPFFSREGANVSLVSKDGIESFGGQYGKEGFVYQQIAKLPNFNGNYALVGSWVVGNKACGLSIREDKTLITTNQSRFLPHYFVPNL